MHKAGNRNLNSNSLVRAKDLVLDPSIDNSLSQALSFYSMAPTTKATFQQQKSHSPLKKATSHTMVASEQKSVSQNIEELSFCDTASRDPPASPSIPLGFHFAEKSVSSASLFSETSGSNSLFKFGDDSSMSKYIAEIEKHKIKELTESPKSEKSIKSSTVSSPKSKTKKFSSMSDLTTRYHNLGNWPAESKEPKATILFVKINEEIIFRETVLNALKSAVDVMDKRYWEYCVERIKATEANRTIKAENILSLKNLLSEAQKHVAVLIAHARSLAIEIIEKVKQLRQLHARNVKTSAPVSIYWKHENYLLKISHDMEFINESHTMRLWLGFTPTELIIPPHAGIGVSSNTAASAAGVVVNHTNNPHDPKAHWLRTHKKIYSEWFKRHEAYILASWKSGKSKVVFKQDRKFLTGDSHATLNMNNKSRSSPLYALGSSSNTPGFTPGITPDSSRPQSPLPGVNLNGQRKHDFVPSPPPDTKLHSPLPTSAGTKKTTNTQLLPRSFGVTVGESTVPFTRSREEDDASCTSGLEGSASQDYCDLSRTNTESDTGYGRGISLCGQFGDDDFGFAPTPEGITPPPSLQHKIVTTQGESLGIASIENFAPVLSVHEGPSTSTVPSNGPPDVEAKPTIASNMTNEYIVPEWVQLRDYAKHSWGPVELETEVVDTNNAYSEYKHGFIDHKHGINDSRYGAHDLKHPDTPDYLQGFMDARHGLSDPVIGFSESLAAVQKKQSVMVMAQGRHVAPLFWQTVDHNPLIVEAATGFEECFPSIYLVPPMPADLLLRAEKCSVLLRHEIEAEQVISVQRETCAGYKESILSSVLPETLNEMSSQVQIKKSIEDASLLKLRQQGNTELLTGISLNHLSQSLALETESLSALLVPSTSQMLASNKLHTQQSSCAESSTENIFLTNNLEQSESQLNVSAPDDAILQPNMQSAGSYVDISGFNFFRIEESSKLRQRIEDRVTEARKMIEYKKGDIFPSLRSDRKGAREPDHDSVLWLNIHAINIQRVVRGFLGRRNKMKRRVMLAFNRSAHKVRSLVIGFMWRYRQRKKYWEARFEAFIMRKLAVKKFRASMTLAAFFRKIVRARRQMRLDDAKEKLQNDADNPRARKSLVASAFTPISRNVRRRHGQLLTDDRENKCKTPSPHRRLGDKSPKIATDCFESRASESRESNRATTAGSDISSSEIKASVVAQRHVTISSQVVVSQIASPLRQGVEHMRVEEDLSPDFSVRNKTIKNIPPKERLRLLEASGPYEESKRREQLKNDALSLVARVNRGKVQSDTVHNCRLIPTQSVPNLSSKQAKMRKFSSKDYAFLNIPSQPAPQSLLKSSSDVFVGPIPKRIDSPPSAAAGIRSCMSMEALRGSASTDRAVSPTYSTFSGDAKTGNGFRGIALSRNGSFSAQSTPFPSSKLAMAGENTLNSNSSVGSGGSGSLHSKSVNLGGSLHLMQPSGSPGYGSRATILRYNSTGLTLRTKKQQEAHERAEAERLQLRSTLMKYM